MENASKPPPHQKNPWGIQLATIGSHSARILLQHSVMVSGICLRHPSIVTPAVYLMLFYMSALLFMPAGRKREKKGIMYPINGEKERPTFPLRQGMECTLPSSLSTDFSLACLPRCKCRIIFAAKREEGPAQKKRFTIFTDISN